MRARSYDVAVFVLYFPACGGAASANGAASAAGRAAALLLDWVREVMRSLPLRALPVILTDLNSKLGLDDEGAPADPRLVAPHDAGAPVWQGHRFMELLESEGMYVANAERPLGPTYYGADPSAKSRIDYVCLPQPARAIVRGVRLLHAAARDLQLIPDSRHRDHIPVEASLTIDLAASFAAQRRDRWVGGGFALVGGAPRVLGRGGGAP